MTEVVRKYSIGSGIVEMHEVKILADLATMYPDEGQRQIVESVLLPHFREKLAKAFNQFREDEKLNSGQPVVPAQLPGLCGAVDGMIEGNKALLDLGGMFKPVIERIQVVRVEIAEALKEQFYQHCREILAGHEVVDRQWLMYKGARWFMQAEFPPYGKGHAFAGKILGKSFGYVGITDLEQIADSLGFEKLSREAELQKYREVLAVHGVTDRLGFLYKGVHWFTSTDFPPYGKGTTFAGKILERCLVPPIRVANLEEISVVLGLPVLSEESKKLFREALGKNGVTDRQSLLCKGPKWFIQTDFPPYGKGSAFTRRILGRTVGGLFHVADLEQIADVLGFERPSREEELQQYRVVLAVYGVTDKQSLLDKGPKWFLRTDFSPYGRGKAFAGKILGRTMIAPIHIADLKEIADALGFKKLSREKELQQYRKILAAHGITDRQGLLDKGVDWFTSADFPPYDKGNAFAGEILGRTVRGVCVTDLNGIADTLELPILSEESKRLFRKALSKNGVTDRQGLLNKGVVRFIQTDFSPYGYGTAFAKAILGKSVHRSVHKGVHIAHLEEIADILF